MAEKIKILEKKIIEKTKELGLDISPESIEFNKLLAELEELKERGFKFEKADASFELFIRKFLGLHQQFFYLEYYKVISEGRSENQSSSCEAIVKMKVFGELRHEAAMGNGPVNALDAALRKALERCYPALRDVGLIDYRVGVIRNGVGTGTAAKVRVIAEFGNGSAKWRTVGVSENIIAASYQAITDSIEYKLLREENR